MIDPDPAPGASASLADAEKELSRAEARASAARERAMRLRAEADADSGQGSNTTDTEDVGTAQRNQARWTRWRPRRPTRKAVALSAAAALIASSLAASGYIVRQHRILVRERHRATEFTAAARQGVVTLLSIDPDHATDNVQRAIDQTTSPLKAQLQAMSTLMVKNTQDAKVTTKATVEDAAVESMTDDSAVVLVVANSDTTNADKTKRPPVWWRLSVDVKRDDGQLKISKLDFVQ